MYLLCIDLNTLTLTFVKFISLENKVIYIHVKSNIDFPLQVKHEKGQTTIYKTYT